MSSVAGMSGGEGEECKTVSPGSCDDFVQNPLLHQRLVLLGQRGLSLPA